MLEKLGGWNTATIAEDAEFAVQCARVGERVWWVPDAVSYDEEPTSFFLSLRQRKRWCSGVMQVARRELGRLWNTSAPQPMLRWDMTMFLLAPFAGAVSALLMIGSFLLELVQGEVQILLPALIWVGCYYIGSVMLSAVLCLVGGYGLRNMGRAVALFPIFMATWLPLQILSLCKDTKQWSPIVHKGHGAVAGYRM